MVTQLARGRRLRHRHRPRRRPSDSARLRRAGVRRPRERRPRRCRRSRSGVRCHRRRHREAVRRPDPSRRNLVSIVGPAEARPADGLAIDFVVESDRAQLRQIVRRVRDGRLRTNIGNVSSPRRCRRRLQPDQADQGEDDHPRSSVTWDGERFCPPDGSSSAARPGMSPRRSRSCCRTHT